MRVKLILGCSAALIAAGVGFWILQANQSNAGGEILAYEDPVAVAAGNILYEETCAVCHGKDLEGDPEWRNLDEDGLMRPPPHDADGHTWHHADEVLFELTKFGTAAYVGSDYQSNMTGFSDILTDKQILDTLAYIKSTWSARLIEINNEINESARLAD